MFIVSSSANRDQEERSPVAREVKQALKFAIVLGLFMGMIWWLNKYNIHPYDETAGPYSRVREVTWLIVMLFMISGLVHAISYAVIVNHAMLKTLKIWLIFLLTLVTSTISTFQLYDWKVIELLENLNFWVFYYPAVSLTVVLIRYYLFWSKNRPGVTRY